MQKFNDPAIWVGIAAFLGSLGAGITGMCIQREWLTIVGFTCSILSAAITAAVTAYTNAQQAKIAKAEADKAAAATPAVNLYLDVDAKDPKAIANLSALINQQSVAAEDEIKIGGTV